VIAILAHDLLRWTQTIALRDTTIRTARTLRRRLITIPGLGLPKSPAGAMVSTGPTHQHATRPARTTRQRRSQPTSPAADAANEKQTVD
jgi:hypothetical protein